jgi:hypothetical protein
MPRRIYGNTDNAPLAPGRTKRRETAAFGEGAPTLIPRHAIVQDTVSGLIRTAGSDGVGAKRHGSGLSLTVGPNEILRTQ